MPIDTLNKYIVGARLGADPDGLGNTIVIANPPRVPMTCEEALTLAAWLVALADGPAVNDEGEVLEGSARTRFDQILEAVHNT